MIEPPDWSSAMAGDDDDMTVPVIFNETFESVEDDEEL